MFTESAELYDTIYFTFKDYAAEAEDIARHIRAVHPDARTVLDVACGTGEHARLLTDVHGFQVDGLDMNAEFVRLARAKLPRGHVVVADMTDFALERQYDAIVCMFSSIGYVRTLPALRQTLSCFRRHLAADGVVIVEPWFAPGVLASGYQSTLTAEADGVRVTRASTTTVEEHVSQLRFDYTIEQGGNVRHTTELHELGLFTVEETLQAFASAGFTVRHEAASARNRGLYIAQHMGLAELRRAAIS